MCGGGGGGSDVVEFQKRQERRRQERVDEGMAMIDRLFNTGTVDKLGSRDQVEDFGGLGGSRTYYDSEGNEVTDSDQAKTLAEKGNLFSGAPQESTGGFDEEFYQGQAEAYKEFATPKVDNQFEEAQADLTAQLSRMGQLQGTLASERRSQLRKDEARARREIASTAQSKADQLKDTVASEKERLTNLIQQTADPAAVSSQASEVTNSIEQKTDFEPLPNFAAQATAGLGKYQRGKRFGQANQRVNSAFSTTPGSSSGSGRVVK